MSCRSEELEAEECLGRMAIRAAMPPALNGKTVTLRT
jgi:hypothetical protein